MHHRILHIDMDAFYAAIEQVDNSELKGRPVIVGGSRRGVVSTASYEARKYGVHSAMPIFQAKRLCPDGIFLPVRMQRYKEVSRQIMRIFSDISPLVEQISIDEAYIDISGTTTLHGTPQNLAHRVKEAIFAATSLTCSIGIAPNKFLAKIASDLNKPNGLTVIEQQHVTEFLKHLPVHKIPGIGTKTSQMLKQLGVTKVGEVLHFPLIFWEKRLGRYGAKLYQKAQGIDNSPVVAHSQPKSYSAEDTFPRDTDDLHQIRKWLLLQAESVGRDLRSAGFRGRTITLKIKFADFKSVTRSRTLSEPTHCTQTIFDTASQLLEELKIGTKVRLVGVGVGNLSGGVHQARLFCDPGTLKQDQLDKALDNISQKFGDNILKRGRVFDFEY